MKDQLPLSQIHDFCFCRLEISSQDQVLLLMHLGGFPQMGLVGFQGRRSCYNQVAQTFPDKTDQNK